MVTRGLPQRRQEPVETALRHQRQKSEPHSGCGEGHRSDQQDPQQAHQHRR